MVILLVFEIQDYREIQLNQDVVGCPKQGDLSSRQKNHTIISQKIWNIFVWYYKEAIIETL